MKQIVSIAIMLFSTFATAADRECVAILLAEGVDNPICVAIDDEIMSMPTGHFNQTVCNPAESTLTLRDFVLNRQPETKNLVTDDCEWEVRAPSGRN